MKHVKVLVEGRRARAIVDAVEAWLLTPVDLWSLAPTDPRYAPHYAGDSSTRDALYHQGTVWPWLMGRVCRRVGPRARQHERVKP